MTDQDQLYEKALKKVADLLARRNHSEKELLLKLVPTFDESIAEKAIETAKEKKWILPPQELAEMAAKSWQRSHKSAEYIAEQLRRKGLPQVEIDPENEIQKIKDLLQKKFRLAIADDTRLTFDQHRKAYQYLANRGFSDDLIRKVIHEQL